MHHIQVKSVLNKTKRRDLWFLDDYTINPFSGCSFNCLYCYIRGSKYGENMEQKLSVKENALTVLEKQLSNRAKKNQYGIIVLASATEPYLQIEKEIGLTRKILELILAYRFPVHVITKSDLVTRDFDLLKEINETAILPADLEDKLQHKAFITFSFSTLDDSIAKIFEPGATPPSARLRTFRETINAGFHSGISLMPLLPLISDSPEDMEHFYTIFKQAGTKYIFPASIALFGNSPADSKTLTLRAIGKYFPDKLQRYEELFSKGFQIDWKYRHEFSKKVKAVKEMHKVPDSIISLS